MIKYHIEMSWTSVQKARKKRENEGEVVIF
jgi:hypothetical protein